MSDCYCISDSTAVDDAGKMGRSTVEEWSSNAPLWRGHRIVVAGTDVGVLERNEFVRARKSAGAGAGAAVTTVGSHTERIRA